MENIDVILDAVLAKGIANGAAPGLVASVASRNGPLLFPGEGRGPDGASAPFLVQDWTPAFSLWLKFILSACRAGSRRAGATRDQPVHPE